MVKVFASWNRQFLKNTMAHDIRGTVTELTGTRTHPVTGFPIWMAATNNDAFNVICHRVISMLKLTSGAHCVYNIKVHVVFVVAYRRKAITHDILSELEIVFREICCNNNVELIEFSGEADHVHLLLSLRPTTNISALIRCLKAVSSQKIRVKHWKIIRNKLWGDRFWTRSYCVISVGDGASTEIIKRYIQNQEKPR